MENPPSRVSWMDDLKVNFSKQIKYLGVVFDWDYTWMPQLDLIQENSTKIQYKLTRTATATWDVRSEVHKAVYLAVAERIVLYAVAIW